MKISLDEIRRLSVAERIQLVEDIWDTIALGSDELPLSETQRQELDRRLEKYAKDPSRGRPWSEVRESLE